MSKNLVSEVVCASYLWYTKTTMFIDTL